MPITRGTLVSICITFGDHVDGVGGTYWIKGRVCSRTKNGWLRVRVNTQPTPIIIRNSPEYVVKFLDPPFPYLDTPQPKEEIWTEWIDYNPMISARQQGLMRNI